MIHIHSLNLQPYQACWESMQTFTHHRNEETADEIWLCEHPPIFTQGQNGQSDHILKKSHIPIVQTDRGGQITYHGPGQLMIYTLIDLKRKKVTIRDFINRLEQSIIAFLADYGICGTTECKAPGVYIEGKKICSLGLRVRRGCTYHGMALNVDMDLKPFQWINPCGFQGLKMTQLSDYFDSSFKLSIKEIIKPLSIHLLTRLT